MKFILTFISIIVLNQWYLWIPFHVSKDMFQTQCFFGGFSAYVVYTYICTYVYVLSKVTLPSVEGYDPSAQEYDPSTPSTKGYDSILTTK